MLKRVEMKNFRCLRDVTVALRPLTVLIGENDSGKSSFLAANGKRQPEQLAEIAKLVRLKRCNHAKETGFLEFAHDAQKEFGGQRSRDEKTRRQ